ncbi:MAG: spondin domain-containing protein [Candidatus Eisenbacteria bacterium]
MTANRIPQRLAEGVHPRTHRSPAFGAAPARALSTIARTLLLGMFLAACSEDDPTGPAGAEEPDSTFYRLTFDGTWSAGTHPDDFPQFAHFSGLIGGSHDGAVSFWDPAMPATPGIQNMAENGSKTPLRDEIEAAIAAGHAHEVISGDGIGRSPGSVDVIFGMHRDYPLVTVVSMIAPSPDWFVGVRSLPLHDGSGWVDSLVVDLYAYDAGTDSGVEYGSSNEPTVPHVPVAAIEEAPFLVEGAIPIVGRFTFVRQ